MPQDEAVSINVSDVLSVMPPALREAHTLMSALTSSPQAEAMRSFYSQQFAEITGRICNASPSDTAELVTLQRALRDVMLKMDIFSVIVNDFIIGYKSMAIQEAIERRTKEYDEEVADTSAEDV